MGSRAITDLTFPDGTGRYYFHWGSPHFQLPNMAAYVFETWANGLPWTLAHYLDFVSTLRPKDLPTEPVDEIGDAQHYYIYEFDASGQVRADYFARNLETYTPKDEWTWSVTGSSRLDLYTAAQHWHRILRANVERRARTYYSIEDLDLDLAACAFRIAVEERPGVAESSSSAAFHAGHDCRAARCHLPLEPAFTAADQ